jgi:5-methylcytosine-specific restriction endonuclease McrA
MNISMDNQTVISAITDISDSITLSSDEIQQKLDEMRILVETKLSELTIDNLKDKCKELGLGGISKLKKPELVSTLLDEFIKLWPVLKDKKANDLKNICKQFNIKGTTGCKKDEIIWSILQHCSSNLILRLDENIVNSVISGKAKNKSSEIDVVIPPSQVIQSIAKLSLIEELEQQKMEIELKMKEEIIKKQKAEEDIQRAKLEEEQKIIEEQRKKEKEEAKKKKQSIPKNVRIIVWNHYIGEDIIKHKCLCCKKVVISNTNFEVGHVISEKNGGTHEINNLRPICFACNHSMGTENMIEFVVKYGLYIG